MAEVHRECFGFISTACSKNAHKALGLDFEETKKCVNESFFGSDRSIVGNSILENNANHWK